MVVAGSSVVVSGVADWLQSAVMFKKSVTARLSRETQVSSGAPVKMLKILFLKST